jgi:AcrR family transcriptional regulator
MSDSSRVPHDGKSRPARTARADKAQETERRLIDAAAWVVGAEGYANASVAKITALAEVAQGTFYNYFASQQDLFDHLLPELGGEMLDFIRGRVHGIADSYEREKAGFRAFFEFLQARPEFYRILNEAETFSPKAFRAHMRNMAEGFLRALARSHAKGEMPGFDKRELEVVVYTLLAARNYLAYRYVAGEGRARALPGWVVDAYMKLVMGGMRFGGTTRRPARTRGKAAEVAQPRPSSPALRIVEHGAGSVQVELDVDAADCDGDGCVRPAALMDLMEATAALAVAGPSGKQTALLASMSASFPARTEPARLAASAQVEGGGGALHVVIRVVRAGAPGAVVASGQAVYATGIAGAEEGGP